MIFHPIHHTFAPHVDAAYAWAALRLLFKPWKWQKGKETDELRAALTRHFQADSILFASGREALLALLQTMNVGKGDEVVIQSFTCLVVPNAIAASGATPIYADIDPETLNLTPETVERVISNRTKAVICQHTFGIPADTERLRDLCDQYELPIIEDCAHIIPDTEGPKEIGKYGDYLILSFGRDKAISGITGGALVIKNVACHGEPVEPSRGAILRRAQDDTYPFSHVRILRLLLYPILYFIARPFYSLGIGKILLWLAAKAGLLVPIVTKKEKEGQMDTTLHAIPNACAALALTQFRKLQQINDHRRMLTKFYLQACKDREWRGLDGITEDLPIQKFPLFPSPTESPLPAGEGQGERLASRIRTLLKRRNIHISDGWTGCTICPPSAEGMATSILSLPTHPTMSLVQAHTIIDTIAKCQR